MEMIINFFTETFSMIWSYFAELNYWETTVFFVCSFVNVMLSTMKSILTIKSTKLVASGMNAISYGFYTIVVQQLVGLPTGIVVAVTIITNMIGVYLSMLILDKVKKDMLWKITVTTPSENLKSIAAQLDEADIGYTYYVATKKKGVMEIYSETSKQSLIIRNILKNYKYKYCITEGQHSL